MDWIKPTTFIVICICGLRKTCYHAATTVLTHTAHCIAMLLGYTEWRIQGHRPPYEEADLKEKAVMHALACNQGNCRGSSDWHQLGALSTLTGCFHPGMVDFCKLHSEDKEEPEEHDCFVCYFHVLLLWLSKFCFKVALIKIFYTSNWWNDYQLCKWDPS